jgi:hypothetical protein
MFFNSQEQDYEIFYIRTFQYLKSKKGRLMLAQFIQKILLRTTKIIFEQNSRLSYFN